MDLAAITLGENTPHAARCVRDIPTRFKAPVLLCAVQRGEQVYIPNGSFQLEAGDRIHFTSKRSDMAACMKELGIYKHPTKHVLIAGGFKVERLMVLCKTIVAQIKKAINGRAVVPVKVDGRMVDSNYIREVLTYLGAYIAMVCVGLFLICFDDVTMEEAVGGVLTCFNNVGPSFGRMSPIGNFGILSSFSKYVLSFLMLAGRLEIYPMLILFYYKAWKRRN